MDWRALTLRGGRSTIDEGRLGLPCDSLRGGVGADADGCVTGGGVWGCTDGFSGVAGAATVGVGTSIVG